MALTSEIEGDARNWRSRSNNGESINAGRFAIITMTIIIVTFYTYISTSIHNMLHARMSLLSVASVEMFQSKVVALIFTVALAI